MGGEGAWYQATPHVIARRRPKLASDTVQPRPAQSDLKCGIIWGLAARRER
jgi:hypothetical protein